LKIGYLAPKLLHERRAADAGRRAAAHALMPLLLLLLCSRRPLVQPLIFRVDKFP
jgi:hypothetical protein